MQAMIKKVVINGCHVGRFNLSDEALAWLNARAPKVKPEQWNNDKRFRTHPILVECVLTLGDRASGSHSKIVCVDIGKGVRYHIMNHNGKETVVTPETMKWDRIWTW